MLSNARGQQLCVELENVKKLKYLCLINDLNQIAIYLY